MCRRCHLIPAGLDEDRLINASIDNVITGPELAARIGEILCDELYRDLSEHKPVITTDEGICWRVEGSRNRDGAIDGLAEFFLSIQKSDARVTDIGEHLRFRPHPSVVPLIHDHFSKKFASAVQDVDVPLYPADNSRIGNTNVGVLLLTEIAR